MRISAPPSSRPPSRRRSPPALPAPRRSRSTSRSATASSPSPATRSSTARRSTTARASSSARSTSGPTRRTRASRSRTSSGSTATDLGAGGAGLPAPRRRSLAASTGSGSRTATRSTSAPSRASRTRSASPSASRPGTGAPAVQRRPRDPSGQGVHAARRLHSRTRLSGPGYTTYHFSEDEFQLSQNLRSHDQEFRVGAAFNAGFISGEVIQGWRKYHETEDLTPRPFAGSGNNTSSTLGKTVSANTLTRSSTTDVNVPVTSAFVRGVRPAQPPDLGLLRPRRTRSATTRTKEGASGSFASFAISRFFTGYSANNTTSPNSLAWRAGGRAEWHVLSGVDVSAGYTERDQTWDNQALLNELFTGTSTFTGVSPVDVQSLLSTQTSIERQEKVFDVQASARFLGPFGIRLGFSRIDQDLTVVEDPAEIVVPGNQGGTFSRSINRYEGALTFSMAGFNLMGEAVLRRRERGHHPRGLPQAEPRARPPHVEDLRLDPAGRRRDVARPEERGRRARTTRTRRARRNYSVDLTLKPLKDIWLRGAYGKLKADSSIPIRQPQDFTVITSVNAEDGELMEAGAGFKFKEFAVDGFWSRFDNTGSYLFRMYRGGARADWSASAQAGLVVEWSVDRYLDYQRRLDPELPRRPPRRLPEVAALTERAARTRAALFFRERGFEMKKISLGRPRPRGGGHARRGRRARDDGPPEGVPETVSRLQDQVRLVPHEGDAQEGRRRRSTSSAPTWARSRRTASTTSRPSTRLTATATACPTRDELKKGTNPGDPASK